MIIRSATDPIGWSWICIVHSAKRTIAVGLLILSTGRPLPPRLILSRYLARIQSVHCPSEDSIPDLNRFIFTVIRAERTHIATTRSRGMIVCFRELCIWPYTP